MEHAPDFEYIYIFPKLHAKDKSVFFSLKPLILKHSSVKGMRYIIKDTFDYALMNIYAISR